jgi:hypothetical protein
MHPRDEASVGWPTPLAKAAYGLAPVTTERMAGTILRRYVRNGPPERKTSGNLFGPVPYGVGTTGGWRKRPPLNAALARRAVAGGIATTGAVYLATAWLRRRANLASPA